MHMVTSSTKDTASRRKSLHKSEHDLYHLICHKSYSFCFKLSNIRSIKADRPQTKVPLQAFYKKVLGQKWPYFMQGEEFYVVCSIYFFISSPFTKAIQECPHCPMVIFKQCICLKPGLGKRCQIEETLIYLRTF